MRKVKLADGTVVFIEKGAALPAGAAELPAEEMSLDEKIAKSVEAAMAPVLETLKTTKATGNMTGAPTGGEQSGTAGSGSRFEVGKEAAEGSGINLIRAVKAKAVAKADGRSAAEVAKAWGYHSVAKTLTQGDFGAGGSLVHQQYAAEFVELLRKRTVVRKAGARQIPMPSGNLTWDRQASAATAYYGQENSAITTSEPSTDQFSLSEKKLTALVPVSMDLVRNASIGAEEFVRDDLLNVMALREDLAFLRGSGSSSEPTGLRYRITSGHIYPETVASEGTVTLAEAKKEMGKAKRKLKDANVPMLNPVWFAGNRAEAALEALVASGGNGSNQLETELASGKLRGFPVFFTNQIPENLGGDGDESELYLVDMSEVIIGDSMNLEVETFVGGAYHNGSSVVSGISNDLMVIRAISKHDINMRHTVSGVVVTELSWGVS